MAQATVRDGVIWSKHIHGDKSLERTLMAMAGGSLIKLRVDGVVGDWRRMDDGRDGRPTKGLRPVGRMAEAWSRIRADKRGQVVEIELAEGAGGPAPIQAATEDERRSAFEAFMQMARTGGWRSEQPYGPRDELYRT